MRHSILCHSILCHYARAPVDISPVGTSASIQLHDYASALISKSGEDLDRSIGYCAFVYATRHFNTHCGYAALSGFDTSAFYSLLDSIRGGVDRVSADAHAELYARRAYFDMWLLYDEDTLDYVDQRDIPLIETACKLELVYANRIASDPDVWSHYFMDTSFLKVPCHIRHLSAIRHVVKRRPFIPEV